MIITQFGDYNNGHRLHYKFDDCSTDSKTLDVYWFSIITVIRRLQLTVIRNINCAMRELRW